jgi:hypothetical protein
MLRLADDASREMADPLEIKAGLHFSFDQLAHESRFGLLRGGGPALEGLALRGRQTDGEGRVHERRVQVVRQIARQRWRRAEGGGRRAEGGKAVKLTMRISRAVQLFSPICVIRNYPLLS